jgi:O-antigen biosynthesis protein
MIVKNEEKYLEQCLNSVKDLVDEMIVVDTGSMDKTKEIAVKFGAKVFDFEWCDDFSAARNESLKHATGDWILVLDADEVISERDVEEIKNLILDREMRGYILIQRNYFKLKDDLNWGFENGLKIGSAGQGEKSFVSSDNDDYVESMGMVGWMPTPIVRLFRNSEKVKFSGVVHEDVSPTLNGKIIESMVPIHHFGKTNVNSWKKKWALYGKLAEKKAKEDNDYYAYFELGRQYLAGKKLDLAKEALLRSKELNKEFWGSWFNLGGIALIQGDLTGAVNYLEESKKLNPNKVDIYVNLGVVFAKKKEFEKAINYFVSSLNLDSKRADIFKNMALCYQEMGDNLRAGLAFKKFKELSE